MSTQKAARGSRKRVRDIARRFCRAQAIRYCRHWNGHYCEICATDSLERLLLRLLDRKARPNAK
jgi:hypothetical protein